MAGEGIKNLLIKEQENNGIYFGADDKDGGTPANKITTNGSGVLIVGGSFTVGASGGGEILHIASHNLSNAGLKLADIVVTANGDELNKLDGVTASTAQLNYLDITTLGTSEDSKAVTQNASGVVTIGATDQDQVLDIASHDLVDGGLKLAGILVTANANELNILDGVTSTAAELNILDGVTATTAELNILDGVTSSAAELNILDGVTSSAAELNVLDASAAGLTDGHVLTYASAGGGSIGFAAASGGGASALNDLSDVKLDNSVNVNNLIIGNSSALQNGATTNTGVGITALDSCTLGTNNSCLGHNAGTAIVSGTFNTCVGVDSGLVVTGNNNTCIGANAGNTVTSGADNTFLGIDADGAATVSNQTAIGHAATCSAANQITLGNGSVTELRCADTSIASLSDRRDKTNIIDSPYGLDFINTVRPVQFTWATREGVATKDGKKRVGFIAQELQEAMPNNQNDILDLVFQADPDRLEAKYGNLLPIMVKAIQELSAEVTSLRAQLSAQ